MDELRGRGLLEGGKKELSPGQLARQKETAKIMEQQKKIFAAHTAYAKQLKAEGKVEEAKAAEETAAHYARLLKESQRVHDNPEPDPKMSISLNTPEGRWFAGRMGF